MILGAECGVRSGRHLNGNSGNTFAWQCAEWRLWRISRTRRRLGLAFLLTLVLALRLAIETFGNFRQARRMLNKCRLQPCRCVIIVGVTSLARHLFVRSPAVDTFACRLADPCSNLAPVRPRTQTKARQTTCFATLVRPKS